LTQLSSRGSYSQFAQLFTEEELDVVRWRSDGLAIAPKNRIAGERHPLRRRPHTVGRTVSA
jgi:hypothetical protein